jgi:AraC-like DNA-binding protein
LIPEPGQTILSFTSFILLLGVVQGLLLSVTGLLKPDRISRLRGFLFLSLTCIITEIFLNRTGYMYKVIFLVDFSEPVQYAIPPLAYLAILSLNPENKPGKWWLHFIPLGLYVLYFLPFYFAPADYKEASYYFIHHTGNFSAVRQYPFLHKWGRFRDFQLYAAYLQMTIYMVLSFQVLADYKKNASLMPKINQKEVNWWLLFNITIGMLVIVIIVVKVSFVRDLGDHIIASFLTFIIYLATIVELSGVGKLRKVENIQPVVTQRQSVSGLSEEKKKEVQEKLIVLMDERKLYRDNLISLTRVARQINEPAYIVSQVINEKMNASFFEWIAQYRVEEAKVLLSDPAKATFTIEQVAEEVGYNSKSAFNKVFKKYTGKTPSEYKNA